MISYWTVEFLRNCKPNSAKSRTIMTFQDHMWKLPWKNHKKSFTQWPLTVSMLQILGSQPQTSFPNWASICFSLGFPDLIFLANGVDALQGLATAEYTGSALLKEGTPLTDDNLGYSVISKKMIDWVWNRKYVVASKGRTEDAWCSTKSLWDAP